jgi:hypothetical protein
VKLVYFLEAKLLDGAAQQHEFVFDAAVESSDVRLADAVRALSPKIASAREIHPWEFPSCAGESRTVL